MGSRSNRSVGRAARLPRALCVLLAASAVFSSTAGLFEPAATESPAAADAADGTPDGTAASSFLAAPGISKVRGGLLEEPPEAFVSILVRLRGDPISSVILDGRARFGPQDSWSPAARELAGEAVDARNEELDRQREEFFGRLALAGLTLSATRDYRYLVNGLNLREVPVSAIPQIAAEPAVLHVERDRLLHIELNQSVALINGDDVWNQTDGLGRNITGEGSVIANIDTGVDYTHPDLGGTLNQTNDLSNLTGGSHTKFLPGWDFVNNDNDPWDDHFHGTHVAGIIGANGTLKGVAPGSKQIPLKVLSASGSGSDSDVIAAMEFATDPDRDPLTDDAADASSMSLGGWDPYPDGIEPLAADASTALGTLTIIAAGNAGPDSSTVESPGVSRKSITVGSTTKSDTISSFSSRGPTLYFDMKPDIVAPGSSIVSTRNGGGGGNLTASGTSMATPHISGVVALMRQAHPQWTVDELKSAMANTAKDLGYGAFIQGAGRVDALGAVNATVLASPHKLAMGRLSRAAAQTNATLEVENIGPTSVTVNLSALDVYGMSPNMTYTNNNTDLNYVTLTPASLNLSAGGKANITVVFAPPQNATAGHYWGRVTGNFSGRSISVPFAYYVRAPLLLVDDDNSDRSRTTAPFDNFAGLPAASGNISKALERLGVAHDIFTQAHYDDNGPDQLELSNYALVIWAHGYEYGYADAFHSHTTFSTRDMQSLAAYLGAGGQLWVVGESLAWDLYNGANTTVPSGDFLNTYLGVGRVDHELNTPNPVNGTAGTFMAGPSYATAPDWTDWSNNGDFATNLTPSSRGFTIIEGNTTDLYGKSYPNASVAVAVNNSTFKTVFWGFEFSWLTTNARFDDAVNLTLSFFNTTKSLSLPANDVAVELVIDPLGSDWLPIFASAWGRSFDELALLGHTLNATVVLRNLGSAAQKNVLVNVTLYDNTTLARQTVALNFSDVPALSKFSQRAVLTPLRHGYFVVNASLNGTDSNLTNNADTRAVLVANWQEEVQLAGGGWNASGDWRVSNAVYWTAPSSWRVGVKSSANDTLASPFLNLSLVNTTSITGGARLYFRIRGVVGGGDSVYFETQNASNSTWVTQQTLSSLDAPSGWSYYTQGVSLSNLAGSSGNFRVRFQTGANSTSYVYLDHFMIWTYHEKAEPLAPAITVLNATRTEGQLLDFRGSHGNPSNSSNFTYYWEFGDGATASTRNATYTYANNGSHLVRFSVNDTLGSNETASVLLVVSNVDPSIASTSSSVNPSSEGSAVTFNATCTDPGTLDVITYRWNFGDGSANATGSSTNHTFANNGSYTVLLTCSDGDGGSASATRTQNVTNAAPSVASTSSSANPSSEGSAVTLNATCTDPGTLDVITYRWNFGDGSANASGSSVDHTFANQGNYTVTLTCSDGDGASTTTTRTQDVTNIAPSVASASSDINPANEGDLVTFLASCTDPGALDALTYTWNFGDGSANATGASPTHAYPNQGNYTVTLVCADGDGGQSSVALPQAVRNVAPAVLNMTPTPGTAYENETVSFAASCSDPGTLDVISYSWNFGDGSIDAAGSTVDHIFLDEGVYNVTLTCSDGDGGATVSSRLYSVSNLPPVVTIVPINSTAEGTAVQLIVTQVYDPGPLDTVAFLWGFGDGSTSTLPTPTHAWRDNGRFLVWLNVTDNDGGSTNVSFFIDVANVAPSAAATAAGSFQEGGTVTFTGAFTDPSVLDTHTMIWDFGDGRVSSLLSPTHVFADEGNYTVSLTVTDDDGGVASALLLVFISNLDPALQVNTNGLTATEGTDFQFDITARDPGQGDNLTLSVDFGDGSPVRATTGTGMAVLVAVHPFPNEGTYTVRVTATDGDGGVSSWTALITVLNSPPALFVEASAYVVDEGTRVDFTATVSDLGLNDTFTVDWDLGPGSAPASGLNASRRFVQDGSYFVNVTASDDAGASTTMRVRVTVRNVAPSLVVHLPEGPLTEGVPLSFSADIFDPGTEDVIEVVWQWGDGTNVTGHVANHTYYNFGGAAIVGYTLQVTATDDAGDSTTQTFDLLIENLPPRIERLLLDPGPAEGRALNFSAVVSNPARDTLTYSWSFGDGARATGLNVTHTYVDDGVFVLRLEVSDGEGSVVFLEEPAFEVANAPPVLRCALCPAEVAQGATVAIRASATDPGRNDSLSYRLVLPDGTIHLSREGAFDISLQGLGNQTLVLTADDGDGGLARVEFQINVLPDFDRDGLPDSLDPDDDNDGAPDATDPAPLDPTVGPPKPLTTTPGGGGLGLIVLLLALATVAAFLVGLRRRRRWRAP